MRLAMDQLNDRDQDAGQGNSDTSPCRKKHSLPKSIIRISQVLLYTDLLGYELGVNPYFEALPHAIISGKWKRIWIVHLQVHIGQKLRGWISLIEKIFHRWPNKASVNIFKMAVHVLPKERCIRRTIGIGHA